MVITMLHTQKDPFLVAVLHNMRITLYLHVSSVYQYSNYTFEVIK